MHYWRLQLGLGHETSERWWVTYDLPIARPTLLDHVRSSSATSEAVHPVFRTTEFGTKMGRGLSTSVSTRAKGKRDRVLVKASRPKCRAAMISWDCSRAALRLVFPPTSATSDPCSVTFCSIQSTTVIRSIPHALHFTPTLRITSPNH